MNKLFIISLILFAMCAHVKGVDAQELTCPGESVSYQEKTQSELEDLVRDKYNFFGLARYFNDVKSYHIDRNGIDRVKEVDNTEFVSSDWNVIVGRLNVIVIKPNQNFSCLIQKNQLHEVNENLNVVRYTHLWAPLAYLSKGVEFTIVQIQKMASDWILSVVIFAVFLKLLLLPIALKINKYQKQVSIYQTKLAPILADIKSKYDGEKAHEEIMKAHKNLGISPFYALKPLLGSLIQVPILIAIFNALGEMPQFSGQSFLWIENVAYPDVIAPLPFTIPLLGDSLSVLPFLMTIITIASTVIFSNRHAPVAEVKKQKRNLYLMAFAFFILFYPFPAVMVLFWTLANILQFIQQQAFKL